MKKFLSTLAVVLFATTTYAHDAPDADELLTLPAICLANSQGATCIIRASITGNDDHPRRRLALIEHVSAEDGRRAQMLYMHVCGTQVSTVKLNRVDVFVEVDLNHPDEDLSRAVASYLCQMKLFDQ